MVEGVKVAVGESVLLSWAVLVFGEPARMDHAPVPFTGALAANAVDTLVMQIVWSGPAFEAVGVGFTTTANCVVVALVGPFEQVVVAT